MTELKEAISRIYSSNNRSALDDALELCEKIESQNKKNRERIVELENQYHRNGKDD